MQVLSVCDSVPLFQVKGRLPPLKNMRLTTVVTGPQQTTDACSLL